MLGFFFGLFIVEVSFLFQTTQFLIGSFFFPNKLIAPKIYWLNLWLRSFSAFFFSALHINLFYNKLFDFLFVNSYTICNKMVDKGFFEFFGPFGFYKSFRNLSLLVKAYPPSVIFFNIGFMFLAITFFLLYIFFLLYLPLFFYCYKGLIGFLIFVILFSNKYFVIN